MNSDLKEILVCFVFSFIWVIKPISFQEIQHRYRHHSNLSSNEVHIFYSKNSNTIPVSNSFNDYGKLELDLEKKQPNIDTAVAKDGTFTIINSNTVRAEGSRIPELLNEKDYENKFRPSELEGLTENEKLRYLHDKQKLPDEVVLATQKKIRNIFQAKDSIMMPGRLGTSRIPGTIFLNVRLNQYGFRDKYYNYQIAGAITDEDLTKLQNSNFIHLFPKGYQNEKLAIERFLNNKLNDEQF